MMIKKEEIKYFDIHSHLHSEFFNEKENSKEIIEKMKKEKIYSIIVGVNFEDSKKALKMSKKNQNLFCSVGIHPTTKESFIEEEFNEILKDDFLDENKKVVSVGECGLDYFWPSNDLKNGKISQEEFNTEKERQKKLFEKHIDFAVKNNLPLMLHIRSYKNSDAHYDTFKILDQKQKEIFRKSFEDVIRETSKKENQKIEANFHFFTETPEIVDEVIKRGFMISLPGVITFADLDKSIKKIPLEKIMSETDSPFAAPKPFRGKVNTPLYVSEIVKKIAEVKEISEEEVRKKTIENIIRFFKL